MPTLFHVSEESGIERFVPRPSKYTHEPVVWAIDADRLCNYLVPRNCPRVTYFAGPSTSIADVERFLGSSPAVVAVESGWWEKCQSTRLLIYRLPGKSFRCVDEGAGYFVSPKPVEPIGVDIFESPMAKLLSLGVELRFVPNLWTLRDAVVVSTLQFSIIRMAASP